MSVPASESLAQRVVHALAHAATAAEASEGVLHEVAVRFGSPLVMLWLLDERSDLLRVAAKWSQDPETAPFRDLSERLTFSAGVGLPGRVLAAQAAERLDDLKEETGFPRAEAAIRADLRWALAAPLLAPGGALGVIEVFGRDDTPAASGQAEELELAARQLATYLGRLDVEERLRVSEERHAAVVEAALDCVITMDHEGRVVDFNPAAEATFGYTREEALGQVLADLLIPPEYRKAHRRALATYVREGRPTILNQRLELTGMRADGSTFPVELTVTRLGATEPPMFAGFIRDITVRRRAEADRDRLLSEAVTSRALAEAAQERAVAAHAAAEQARADAEVAGMRLALLAQAGERMLATRDYEETMQQVVELAVPAVADWCSLTVAEPDGALRVVAVAHRDPRRTERGRDLAERHAPQPEDRTGAAAVIRTGRIELMEGLSAPPDDVAEEDGHLGLLRTVEAHSALTVPLRSPRRVFGALTLAMCDRRRSFGSDDVSMAASLAARSALAIENARLFSERSHIAETLQRSLLPTRLPEVPGLDVEARYRAAGEANLVGGDFYDVFRSGDGTWTAILGDVSGKGPEAAALTALIRHTLRAGAQREPSPRANLRLLNGALLANRDGGISRFATVVYARITRDDEGVLVTVSTGGHLPPLVMRADGRLEPVEIRGTVLGAVEDLSLDDVEVRLAPGDLMLFYTDGVTEVRPREPGYGEGLLRDVLLAHGGAPAGDVVRAVERAAVGAQEGEPRDDIALIALRAV